MLDNSAPVDVVLIVEAGRVAQVWRNTTVEDVPTPDVGELIAMPAGQAVYGMIWDGEELSSPPPPPVSLPPEIPMHKARKALKQLGPAGAITPEAYEDSWWMRVLAVIDGLENPIQRASILDELNTAPNMVLAGASTLMIAAAVGMSQEQLEAVASLALTLP